MKHSLMTALLLVATIVVLTSCGVTNNNSFTSRSRYIEGGRIKEQPKAAEIDVDFSMRVTAQSDWQPTKSAARTEAEHKAITEYGIDLVIEPIWKYTASPVFSRKDGAPWYPCYKAELVGFAGKYRKTLSTEERILQLQDIDLETIEKYKLLTDPDFKDVYYQQEPQQPADNSVKGSVIIQGGLGAPVPAATVAPPTTTEPQASIVVKPTPKQPKPVKEIDYFKRGTSEIKAGKAFVSMGIMCLAAGFCALGADISFDKKANNIHEDDGIDYSKRDEYWERYQSYRQWDDYCDAIKSANWDKKWTYWGQSSDARISWITFFSVGGAFELIGISCWAAGSKDIKRPNNSDLTFNYQVAPTGVNLALKF